MATALFAFPAGFGAYLVSSRWRALRLRRHLLQCGTRAQAVVVEREATRERPSTRSYWSVLEFALPGGRRHQVRCETSHRFYLFHPPGARAMLRYSPDTPDEVALEGDEPLSAKRHTQIVMGAIFFVVAVITTIQTWRR
jgi:hypothetical protein